MTEARSVRHAQDSCDGCLSQAAAGWMPVGQLVLPGERDCLRNCKCTVEYRKVNLNARIDELVKKAQGGGALTKKEINELAEGVANSGFPTAPQRVTVDSGLVGVEWNGRRLKLGDRIPSDHWHYLKHVVVQKEWPAGTTYADYIRQIKEVVTDPKSGILYSKVGRNTQITFIRRSDGMRGPDGHPWVIVDYRPRLHSTMTMFQPRGRIDTFVKGRNDQVWIRKRAK